VGVEQRGEKVLHHDRQPDPSHQAAVTEQHLMGKPRSRSLWAR
jgi:hypothetical protein